MRDIVEKIKSIVQIFREDIRKLFGFLIVLLIAIGLPLSLIAAQNQQISQQHAASEQKITLPDGGKLVFTIHVNNIVPGSPVVFYISSTTSHIEPTKSPEPTKLPKIEPTKPTDHKESSGNGDAKTQVKGIETAEPNDGANEPSVHHSEPTVAPEITSGENHTGDGQEPTGTPETKDFIPSQVYTTDDNGDIILSVNPSDHLIITPLVSKGYASISPSSVTVYVLQAQCGISTPCIFTATPLPNDNSTTPTPELCIPRPHCLDATPRCLIAEPVEGWCPKPTNTPEPTVINDKNCPQLPLQCHYTGSGVCIAQSSNTCSCGEIVCTSL